MKLSLVLLATLTIPITARVDDGAVTYGGTPKLLGSHPSISMASEKIAIRVGVKWVDVDCRFVFKNTGKACTVRMGFPDMANGSSETDYGYHAGEAEEKGKKYPPFNGFEFFKSWVDGKPAKVSIVPMEKLQAKSWHVKDVKFKARQTRIVHDVYRVAVGGGMTNSEGFLSETSYVMHTGASWKGPIGNVEVLVTFNRPKMTNPLSLSPVPNPESAGAFGYDGWPKAPKGLVMWMGFAKPTISGRTLRFTAHNLEPTEKDDVYVAFQYQAPKKPRQ